MRLLSQVLIDDFGIDLAGWTLTLAGGISSNGTTIVGRGTNPSGFTEAWIAVLPEPSTATLLGCGLITLAILGRSREVSHVCSEEVGHVVDDLDVSPGLRRVLKI